VPNRVIKDTIWSSKSLAKLKPYYQDQWPRWLLMADDWGCFNADPEVIAGLVYPKRREGAAKVSEIRQVYQDIGQLFVWEEGGREWGFFTGWDNHQFCNKLGVNNKGKHTKHRRKTPAPPEDSLTLYSQEHTKEFDNVRQDSTKLLNPNPIPNPIPNPKLQGIFDAWNSHPNIRPKHRVLNKATEQAINARLKQFTPDEICTAINNYGNSTDEFWIEWREVKRGWSLEQFLSRGEGAKVEKFLDGPINEKGKSAKRAYPCRDAAKYEGKPVCKKLQEWDGRGVNPCDGCGDYTP